MSFFDKLKQGVNDAGQKAKAAVELNRLKGQLQTSQKQIEEKQASIGGIVYHQFDTGGADSFPPAIEALCQEIALLQMEVRHLNSKLKEMNNEKECTCGKIVPLDTRFCQFCGYEFAKQPEIIEITVVKAPENEQARSREQTEINIKTESERKEN